MLPETTTDQGLRPGRSCPIDYRYGARSLARPAELIANTIYVIGGLYGNPFALDAALRLLAADPDARLVFNGDFNWFDVDDASFVRINREVLTHRALRGITTGDPSGTDFDLEDCEHREIERTGIDRVRPGSHFVVRLVAAAQLGQNVGIEKGHGSASLQFDRLVQRTLQLRRVELEIIRSWLG